jgi:hypothetical protein
MSRRIEAGPLLAAAGAVAVLTSLFLDWFEPDLSAWTTFEIVDLLLAAISLAVLVASASRIARQATEADRELRDRWAPAGAALALLLVVATLINHPPAAIGLGVEAGIWIALGGALAMALGTLADRAQVSLSFSPRQPAPGRPAEPPRRAPAPPPGSDEETRPLG